MGARELLMRGYERMQRAVAPRVRYSQEVYEEVLRTHVTQATAWLDLGCGRRILPPWRGDAEQSLVHACPQVVGVDIDLDAIADNRSVTLKCLATGAALPFADESFDLVTANMVVEHLEAPTANFQEISRVLKPRGAFLFHTPNALGYPTLLARMVPEAVKKRAASLLDGRREEDVYPTFYRANNRRSHCSSSCGSGRSCMSGSPICERTSSPFCARALRATPLRRVAALSRMPPRATRRRAARRSVARQIRVRRRLTAGGGRDRPRAAGSAVRSRPGWRR